MPITNPYASIEQWTEEELKKKQAIDPNIGIWKEGADVPTGEDVPTGADVPIEERASWANALKLFPFLENLDFGKGTDEFPWEEFGQDFPGLDVSTYEGFGGEYPFGGIPVYDPFGEPYPGMDLPRYEEFRQPFPELGGLYGEAEDLIGRLLRGEEAGIPVEEIMSAYSAEEQRALEEYMPEIRESWAERGLLRSGMARESEREAVLESAERRATKRAGLMKEDVLLQRQSMVTGIGLAMQHLGMGYDAQKDAYTAASNEYTKVYQSALQAGIAEGEAAERAWGAANQEYARQFASQVDATKFSQEIKERAYESARDEYSKVYRSQLEIGLAEFEAQAAAWEAARTEYARIQQMEFQKKMIEMEQKFQKEMQDAGISASNTQSIWGSIGGIIGSIFGGPIGGAIGAGIGGLFGGGGTSASTSGVPSAPF